MWLPSYEVPALRAGRRPHRGGGEWGATARCARLSRRVTSRPQSLRAFFDFAQHSALEQLRLEKKRRGTAVSRARARGEGAALSRKRAGRALA